MKKTNTIDVKFLIKREKLIKKLKEKNNFLTKQESEELGPVTSREIAPISGDSFVDELINKKGRKNV